MTQLMISTRLTQLEAYLAGVKDVVKYLASSSVYVLFVVFFFLYIHYFVFCRLNLIMNRPFLF